MEWRNYFWKMAAVCVLVSAVLLTGCGGTGSPADPPPPITDPALNGTWVGDGGVLTFYNGSYVIYNAQKGIFSTSGDTLTMQETHVHGNNLPSDYAEFFEGREWIPIAELIVVSDEVDEYWFLPVIWTYKVEGNTLTLTHPVAGTTWTFTRQ